LHYFTDDICHPSVACRQLHSNHSAPKRVSMPGRMWRLDIHLHAGVKIDRSFREVSTGTQGLCETLSQQSQETGVR